MLENVHPYMVMVALRDLFETPSYKVLNVIIHHQWANFFALYMNLKSQIFIYSNASFDNFNSDNEEIHCTPISSMIHNQFIHVF
jgi:hypothetical protein